jgi:nucleotide-binding universal stress UspA family protein
MSQTSAFEEHRSPAARPEPLEELHLHRLLVCIDGSPTSELALRRAITMAHQDHAAVTLLVVVPDFSTQGTRWVVAGAPSPAELQEDADHHASRLLRETVERLPSDISVTTVLRRGRPGPEICAYARECGTYDAIMLGARGSGRIASVTTSVSNYVLRHADTAVFIAHPARGRH